MTCNESNSLQSFELNFKYNENGQDCNALVKVRTCPDCSTKLHYNSNKEKKRARREQRRAAKELKSCEDRNDESDGKRRKLNSESPAFTHMDITAQEEESKFPKDEKSNQFLESGNQSFQCRFITKSLARCYH